MNEHQICVVLTTERRAFLEYDLIFPPALGKNRQVNKEKIEV